jgi:hypothetical protein
MNSELLEQLRELGEQRRAQVQSALNPGGLAKSPSPGPEPASPSHPDWIHSLWFEEWKRLAGINS